MPQASEELRKYWGGVSLDPAMRHLESRGFVLTKQWTWIPPNGVTWETMTKRDRNAVDFLCYEWDFGGLEPQNAASE